MCLYNKIIHNPKYKPNKKNGGKLPPFSDKRVLAIPIKCGDCMECRKAKQREWQVRLHEEIKRTELKKYFVTLTFNDESLKELTKDKEIQGYDTDNEIAQLAVRRFTELWRKHNKKTVRHWLVTELGGGRYEHLHLHGIILTNKNANEIQTRWKYGHIWVGEYVNEKTINYIVKYIAKPDEKHKHYKPKIFASKGIGSGYTNTINAQNNKYKGNKTIETYRTPNGSELPLPIYYRNKIYTEEEREKLWLIKLDKETRYVNGKEIKIDTPNGYKQYLKLRDYYRLENTNKGFINKYTKQHDKEYENQRRKLILTNRIKQNNNVIDEITPPKELTNIW